MLRCRATKRLLVNLRTWADRLLGLSANLGALGLLVEVIVIMIDVVGRFFGSPLYGSQDMVTMGMVVLVFGGMAMFSENGSTAFGGGTYLHLLDDRLRIQIGAGYADIKYRYYLNDILDGSTDLGLDIEGHGDVHAGESLSGGIDLAAGEDVF